MNNAGQKQQVSERKNTILINNKEESKLIKDKVWDLLQSETLSEYRFDRNKKFGPVTVDFYCEIYRIAVVVDKDEEFYTSASSIDPESQTEMEQMGIVVLRFHESEIIKNPYIVQRTIGFWLKEQEFRYL